MLRNAICNRVSSAAAIAVFVAALGGCATDINQRGNLPQPDKLAEIHPGTTTRDQVVKILGTQSSTGMFDNNSWYYISRRTKQVAFLDPDVIDQQVYVIDFDPNGVVKSVDHKGLRDAREITPAPGATPAPGRELTFLEQVLGNIGRFNKQRGQDSSAPQASSNSERELYAP